MSSVALFSVLFLFSWISVFTHGFTCHGHFPIYPVNGKGNIPVLVTPASSLNTTCLSGINTCFVGLITTKKGLSATYLGCGPPKTKSCENIGFFRHFAAVKNTNCRKLLRPDRTLEQVICCCDSDLCNGKEFQNKAKETDKRLLLANWGVPSIKNQYSCIIASLSATLIQWLRN